MAISKLKKRAVTAAPKDFPGATTHFPNETDKAAEPDAATAINHQTFNDILVDPEDVPGSTHFRNEQEYTDKSKSNVKAASRVKATEGVNMEEDWAESEAPAEDPNATFTENEDPNSGVVASEGPQATTHFSNGEAEPEEDGYVLVGDLTDLEDEDETFEDEDEVDADALEDDAGQAPQQSLLDVTEGNEVDAEFEDFEGEPEGEPEEVEEEAVEEETANVDEVELMDIDGMDDDGEDAVFAAHGTKLHVIKSSRIIATMTKSRAVKSGVEDVYLSEQFQDAASIEVSKHGLRAGLTKMGFGLAKVNVAASAAVNKRVESKVKKVTAAIRRSAINSNEALGQCLAIAAVGINRQYFKDAKNELRAALEDELTAAGVRGGTKLVRRVFASHGVDYAKAILTLANKLVSMPETARNAFAEALDMTSDGEVDDMEEDEDDMFGDESSPDFQVESSDDEDFVDVFEEEDEAPETIHAALLRPARKTVKVKASYSPDVMAFLKGR